MQFYSVMHAFFYYIKFSDKCQKIYFVYLLISARIKKHTTSSSTIVPPGLRPT